MRSCRKEHGVSHEKVPTHLVNCHVKVDGRHYSVSKFLVDDVLQALRQNQETIGRLNKTSMGLQNERFKAFLVTSCARFACEIPMHGSTVESHNEFRVYIYYQSAARVSWRIRPQHMLPMNTRSLSVHAIGMMCKHREFQNVVCTVRRDFPMSRRCRH